MVADGSKQVIAGATVYLVPAGDVAQLAKQPSVEIRKDVPNDEPMEDNLATNRDKYQRGITDQKGAFAIPQVADGKYFVYVEPADREHLPGGDLSNKAMTAAELVAKPLAIMLSGKAPENATFVGSTKCLSCHESYGELKKTLHKLGITVVGKPGKLQDLSRFPAFNAGLDKLKAGRKFYFSAFDKARGFDKYQISEKAPADPAAVSFTATFFNDADGALKFKTENVLDPTAAPRTYTVEMTYGGGLYKQRYLYRVAGGLFPFVQYNTEGDDGLSDRSRKPWRDYHADWLFDEETKKLSDPPKKKSFEIECASCHFNGYSLTPTVAGEFVAGAANDPNGEADIDGDGIPNELNVGCEICHGPGSEHAKSPEAKKAATIVNPGRLAAERATVICDQCHSRPQGNLKNDQPVSKENRMPSPGISRNEYLVNTPPGRMPTRRISGATALQVASPAGVTSSLEEVHERQPDHDLRRLPRPARQDRAQAPGQAGGARRQELALRELPQGGRDEGAHGQGGRLRARADQLHQLPHDQDDADRRGARQGARRQGRQELLDERHHLPSLRRAAQDQRGGQGRGAGQCDADPVHQCLRVVSPGRQALGIRSAPFTSPGIEEARLRRASFSSFAGACRAGRKLQRL
jgi:hypothetical protein